MPHNSNIKLVGAVGLEPTELVATDLQSAGVTNFPTHPLYFVFHRNVI